MQVLNTRIKKIIPMYIIVTYMEYVKVLEAIKTQKRMPWKETFLESVFLKDLIVQEIILDLPTGFQ